jgi:hypothetical protein
MGCITITTKGIAQFTDPIVEAVEIGSSSAIVLIKTSNIGTAPGTAEIEVTLDGKVVGRITSEVINPGSTWTKNYEVANLSPATSYTICANLRG